MATTFGGVGSTTGIQAAPQNNSFQQLMNMYRQSQMLNRAGTQPTQTQQTGSTGQEITPGGIPLTSNPIVASQSGGLNASPTVPTPSQSGSATGAATSAPMPITPPMSGTTPYNFGGTSNATMSNYLLNGSTIPTSAGTTGATGMTGATTGGATGSMTGTSTGGLLASNPYAFGILGSTSPTMGTMLGESAPAAMYG